MKRIDKIDKTWIGIILAAIAAVAAPFGLAVGLHSHPVGHHSHPVPVPRIIMTKVADQHNSRVGTVNGYSVEARNNSNVLRAVVTEIVDTLPEGFSYLPGSTSGEILDDPVVDGRKLRWRGPFRLDHNEILSFHFEVRVAERPGVYRNVVDARARRPFLVTGTGPTAPIVVGVPTALEARASLIRGEDPVLKYSARLTSFGRPLQNKFIDFYAQSSGIPANSFICSAVTNAQGVAECTGVVELVKGIPTLGWEAAFEPYSGIYAPSYDHGDLIE